MSDKHLKLVSWNQPQKQPLALSPPYYSYTKVNIFYLVELLIGIIITIFAIYFNTKLSKFPKPPTNSQLNSMILYIFMYPLGFMFIMDSIPKIIVAKSISIIIKSIILILLGLICIIIPLILFLPNQLNGSQFFKIYQKPSISSYNYNQYVLSFQLFVLWVPIGILFIACAFRMWAKIADKHKNINRKSSSNKNKNKDQNLLINDVALMNESMSSQQSNPSQVGITSLLSAPIAYKFTIDICYLYLFIFVLLPLMWLSTTLLPAGYSKFQLPATGKPPFWSIKSKSPSKWTLNLHINDIYLHIYTDVFVFYFCLFLTLLCGYIMQQYKYTKKLLRKYICLKRIRIPILNISSILYLKIGEILLFIFWIPIIILIFIYFTCYHNYNDGNLEHPLKPFSVEKFLRTCGILSTIFCGLCLIPVTRTNSLLKYCFSISFSDGIKYHRLIGLLMIIFAFIHFIGFIILLIKNNLYSIHIFSSKMPFNSSYYHSDNWTLSMIQIIVLFSFLPFCITTLLSCIRRKYFSLFYFIHIYCSLIIIISLMYHATQSWYFMLPGLILQFQERLQRLYLSTNYNNAYIRRLKRVSTNVSMLQINNLSNYHPHTSLGSYYFINIPHISLFTWHPFSISNALNNEFVRFYIKNMRSNSSTSTSTKLSSSSFSSSLCNLSSKISIQKSRNISLNLMNINIDGPYGCDIDYHSYNRLVLIAGGIGITPLHNIFFTLYNEARSDLNDNINNLPSIDLIWIVRYADIFEMYKKSFDIYVATKKDLPNMKISLFATREEVNHPYSKNDTISHDDIIKNNKYSNFDVSKFSIHGSMNNIKSNKKQKKSSNMSNNSSLSRSSSNIREVDCQIKWKIGRPDLFQELSYLNKLRSKAIINVCGPKGLVNTCKELAYLYGNHFKKETFLF